MLLDGATQTVVKPWTVATGGTMMVVVLLTVMTDGVEEDEDFGVEEDESFGVSLTTLTLVKVDAGADEEDEVGVRVAVQHGDDLTALGEVEMDAGSGAGGGVSGLQITCALRPCLGLVALKTALPQTPASLRRSPKVTFSPAQCFASKTST